MTFRVANQAYLAVSIITPSCVSDLHSCFCCAWHFASRPSRSCMSRPRGCFSGTFGAAIRRCPMMVIPTTIMPCPSRLPVNPLPVGLLIDIAVIIVTSFARRSCTTSLLLQPVHTLHAVPRDWSFPGTFLLFA